MRTILRRYHLGGGLALAYVHLPVPALRTAALALLGLATIVATLCALRRWRPVRRLPFQLFAAGEAVGFAAGSLGPSVAVTGAGGGPLAALGCRWAQGYPLLSAGGAADMGPARGAACERGSRAAGGGCPPHPA